MSFMLMSHTLGKVGFNFVENVHDRGRKLNKKVDVIYGWPLFSWKDSTVEMTEADKNRSGSHWGSEAYGTTYPLLSNSKITHIASFQTHCRRSCNAALPQAILTALLASLSRCENRNDILNNKYIHNIIQSKSQSQYSQKRGTKI